MEPVGVRYYDNGWRFGLLSRVGRAWGYVIPAKPGRKLTELRLPREEADELERLAPQDTARLVERLRATAARSGGSQGALEAIGL